MACEYSNENINVRVNGIAPGKRRSGDVELLDYRLTRTGYFPSELTTGASAADNKSPWPLDEFQKEMKRVGAKISRPGTEQEMAKVRHHVDLSRVFWLTRSGNPFDSDEWIHVWTTVSSRRWNAAPSSIICIARNRTSEQVKL